MKKTKIVSTLGPASNNLETISKLIESGANVFRFNFSHGDHEEQLGRMTLVHEAVKLVKMSGSCLIQKVLKSAQRFKELIQVKSNLKSAM